MKKLALTIAIVLGLGMTAFANGDNNNGGLFKRGSTEEDYYGYFGTNRDGANPLLPNYHNNNYDANGQNGNPTPVGSGVLVLLGLGGAYLIAKRREE